MSQFHISAAKSKGRLWKQVALWYLTNKIMDMPILLRFCFPLLYLIEVHNGNVPVVKSQACTTHHILLLRQADRLPLTHTLSTINDRTSKIGRNRAAIQVFGATKG